MLRENIVAYCCIRFPCQYEFVEIASTKLNALQPPALSPASSPGRSPLPGHFQVCHGTSPPLGEIICHIIALEYLEIPSQIKKKSAAAGLDARKA